MLTDAFAKALRNLLLPGIIKLFLLCLVAYIIGFIVITWGVTALVAGFLGLAGGEGVVAHMIGSVGGMMIAWFLFPLLYPILISFFDDYMAEAIEASDYPHLPKAAPPFWPTFAQDALFSLKAVVLNVLLLPFYFIPLVGLVLYYGVNGWLLGTQFFRMAAGRRVSLAEAKEMLSRKRGAIIFAGVLISFSATIPLLNLAAPLLGVATMLHLFHAMKGNDRQQVMPL